MHSSQPDYETKNIVSLSDVVSYERLHSILLSHSIHKAFVVPHPVFYQFFFCFLCCILTSVSRLVVPCGHCLLFGFVSIPLGIGEKFVFVGSTYSIPLSSWKNSSGETFDSDGTMSNIPNNVADVYSKM